MKWPIHAAGKAIAALVATRVRRAATAGVLAALAAAGLIPAEHVLKLFGS